MLDSAWETHADLESLENSTCDVDMYNADEEVGLTMAESVSSNELGGSGSGSDLEQAVLVSSPGEVGGEDNMSTASFDSSKEEGAGSEFSFSTIGDDEEETDSVDGFVDLAEPFDMTLLRSSIENGGAVLDKVHNKDVVLVVGKTGVGKSLFIQGIAGKNIVEIEHQTSYSGSTARSKVYEAEDALPGFEVGHKKVSKTRSINCFIRQGAGKAKRDLVWLDSPGFEDTAGPEVDIATSVMLSQVAKSARSLKFVVLINHASLLEDRGGAVRAVLKLAHTFVSDFETDKKSFMFLFTHLPVSRAPGALDEARLRIEEEILCILEGTDDPDVEKVLKFMHKSIHKKYPFVDILHPLQSDFKCMSTFVETKLSTIKNPADTMNCGLTSQAQMKLMGQVQRMFFKMRGLLHEKNINEEQIAELKNIYETLDYFNLYIGITEVQKTFADCKVLIEKYNGTQRLLLEEQLKKARDSNEFFNTGNAKTVKSVVARLAAFSGASTLSEFEKLIDNAFYASYGQVMDSAEVEDWGGSVRELAKLKAWAEDFDRFTTTYEKACCSVGRDLSSVATGVVGLDSLALDGASEKLLCQAHQLLKLQEVVLLEKKLQSHDIDTTACSKAFNDLASHLSWLVEQWAASPFDRSNEQVDPLHYIPPYLRVAADRAKTLEQVHVLLVQTQACPDIAQVVSRAISAMQGFVVTSIQTLCDGFSPDLNDSPHGLEEKWTDLEKRISIFRELPSPRWKEVRQPYLALRENLSAKLKARAAALEHSARQCQRTLLQDGKKAGEKFVVFQRFAWFDSSLDRGFVQGECDAIRLLYRSRMEDVLRMAHEISEKLQFGSTDNIQLLQECYQAFIEIQEFEEFEKQLGEQELVVERRRDALVGLKRYRHGLLEKSKRWIASWSVAMEKREFDEARTLTETLNAALAELESIESFRCMQGLKADAAAAKSCILGVLKKTADYADSEFNKPAEYKAKADYLSCLTIINGFSATDAYLPQYSVYRERARALVSNDALKVEKMVEECADGNKIDECLEAFKLARVLDPYIGDEASTRLRPLEALREKKGDEQDKLLESMVELRNYAGIGKFLRPLGFSNDTIKKQRFDQYRRRLAKDLKDLADCTHVKVNIIVSRDDAKAVAGALGTLKDANKEVAPLLLTVGINLQSDCDKLQNKLRRILHNHTESILAGHKSDDFYMMGKNHHLGEILFDCAQPFLTAKIKHDFESASSKFKIAIKDVRRHVDNFLSSSFRESTRINCILESLQASSTSEEPQLPILQKLYQETVQILSQQSRSLLQEVRAAVTKTESYDDGIEVLEAFDSSCKLGMSEHLSALPYDYKGLLCEWKEKRAKLYVIDSFDDKPAVRIRECKLRLDNLKNRGWVGNFVFRTHKTYENLQERLGRLGEVALANGLASLGESDFSSVRQRLDLLCLMAKELTEHIPDLPGRKQQLEDNIVIYFIGLCKKSAKCLESANCLEADGLVRFEGMFPDWRNCALDFPYVLDNSEAKKEFCLVNQLVHDIMKSGISELNNSISNHDFCDARTLILYNRRHGNFLADNFSLFREELIQRHTLEDDMWLSQISTISAKFFSEGRDFANLKSCSLLGVLPSASEEEIRKAYKQKARHVHPDKKNSDGGEDTGAAFRKIKEAHDTLLDTRSREKVESKEQPFDTTIQDIPAKLKDAARTYLREQKYDSVEALLEKISNFEMVCQLVSPPVDYETTRSNVFEIVRDCVRAVRTDVETKWNERDYRELNQSILDLKQMEQHLKSFSQVFPESWNRGIIEKVEAEIDSLGQKARSFLQNEATATNHKDDFRRCFIQMGSVLVELQSFKDYTKSVMYGVLESCLKSHWGHSYLFELGLSFHQGDQSTGEDENRVAQTLLSEFSQFKEVLTMVWNEETAQKPVEETVRDIKGEQRGAPGAPSLPFQIDRTALLTSFGHFDAEYKSLLGEYLAKDSDKGALAKKTIAFANSLKPLSCEDGWNSQVRSKIPKLLAGVFALFTIMKSGESFNRIQDSPDAKDMGQKLLLKPHNIQVLTLLHLLGCGKQSSYRGLESHLMQIRTGEGKSMILGAAAAMLALLGFKVRCVCYSEYLSNRDYSLFEDLFRILRLHKQIQYSKITTLSEDTTAKKGDIRALTESLLRQKLPERVSNRHPIDDHALLGSSSRNVTSQRTVASQEPTNALSEPRPGSAFEDERMEEILLIDEIDVFFGPDFYGQTYNKVLTLHEPEIAEIISNIWAHHSRGGRKQRLSDIQASVPYRLLLQKMPSFKFLVDNEIRLMLDNVRRVDEEPYYLDAGNDRIGYKVLDTISYQATYGYRTVFAYLKEAENGALKDKHTTLQRVLCMPIQCGQFSYADISPSKILGVSGTLEAMVESEKNVLLAYDVDKYIFVPSVYGKSNFVFDKAGDGIFIEPSKSEFFQKVADEIQRKSRQKRAVIVFFKDNTRLEEFKRSAFYPLLGRHKAVLSESMDPGEKEFVINKAATAGQVTLCSAVFGRGTDFFCKDDKVQEGGGVHIIQTFLSMEKSEEVQIQGRTSRQGKKGSYQMVLLEDDLYNDFHLPRGEKENVRRDARYEWLCSAREKRLDAHWAEVEESLRKAQKRNAATHEFFDALLAGSKDSATTLFKELYLTINKPPVPDAMSVDMALLIDTTGSMAPYCGPTVSTIDCLVRGNNSILAKLKSQFPETEIKLRVGVLCYRDIDDGNAQFSESHWNGSHFTESMSDALSFAKQALANASGGHDLAEDHLGAIKRCLSWSGASDWSSSIKMAILFTDAPAHGFVPSASSSLPNADGHAVRHPNGLTPESVVGELLSKGINLLLCSYNNFATEVYEEKLADVYLKHPLNSEGREIKTISMVPRSAAQVTNANMIGDFPRHIVFVLDESGSMQHDWGGVVAAFHKYLTQRRQNQNESDIVSVVQFDGSARVTVLRESIGAVASRSLGYSGGGTCFAPAALEGSQLAASTPSSHKPTVVFMSDGGSNDADIAACTFAALNRQVKQKHGCDLDLHVIAFGGGADTQQLQQIARSSPKGRVYLSSDSVQLSNIFVNIAGGQQVATVLQEEIGREISDAVSDTLSLGYLS